MCQYAYHRRNGILQCYRDNVKSLNSFRSFKWIDILYIYEQYYSFLTNYHGNVPEKMGNGEMKVSG